MKKEILISNPNGLPTVNYRKLRILQGNLKTLSEENLTKLCNSIKRYNFFAPAFVWRSGNDLYILDATQRYHALEQLEKEGYEIPKIPFIEIEAKDKKDAAEKLLQITSRYGTINEETTFFEDFDIDLSFINDIEIPELDVKLDELESEIIEDEVPEPPIEPLSKTGDLWLCGKHRVLCGDATKEADIKRCTNRKQISISFTSPPYNVAKNSSLMNRHKYIIGHDEMNETDFLNMLQSFTNEALKISEYVFVNIQSLSGNKVPLIEYLYALKEYYADTMIWDKEISEPAMAKNVLNSRFEYVHIFSQKGNRTIGTNEFRGTIDNVIRLNSHIDKDFCNIHKATFPIAFASFFINNFSKITQTVFDPFLGSGTTLIACEQLNRICYGCEIDPHYIGVILDRYAKFTGDDPIRESDNVKWSELKSSKVVK